MSQQVAGARLPSPGGHPTSKALPGAPQQKQGKQAREGPLVHRHRVLAGDPGPKVLSPCSV